MNFIWATRGRTWGFCFLRSGGFLDPLVEYDKAFSSVEDSIEAYRQTDNRVALRFPDPLGRKDRVGRTIPHEFVLEGSLASKVHSVKDGLNIVWPHVADEYAEIWDSREPPAMTE